MSDQFSKVGRLLVAPESTYATDAVAALLTTATADIVYQAVEEADLVPGLSPILRQRVIGTAERVAHDVYGEQATLTVKGPLTTSVAAASGDELPPYAPFLEACGFRQTINAGTGSEFDLVTPQQSAMSAYLWRRNIDDDNWRLLRSVGLRGLLTLSFAVGQEAMWSAEMTGRYVDLESAPAEFFDPDTFEVALLADGSTAVTARTTGEESWANMAGAICESITFEWDGGSLDISELELKTNRALRLKKTMQGSSAVSEAQLVPGTEGPGGSFNLMSGGANLTTVAAAVKAATEGTLELVLTRGARTITITSPVAQLLPYDRVDDSGALTYKVPFALNRDWSTLVGDTSLKIEYT